MQRMTAPKKRKAEPAGYRHFYLALPVAGMGGLLGAELATAPTENVGPQKKTANLKESSLDTFLTFPATCSFGDWVPRSSFRALSFRKTVERYIQVVGFKGLSPFKTGSCCRSCLWVRLNGDFDKKVAK